VSERQVLVRIRAEIGDFRKQMQEASKVTEQVGKATEETAAKSKTALGQMVQSASRHEQAWTTSGAALLGFGAAVSVGVGLAIKTYAEFDKAMSEVSAATHASAGDMDLLRAAAIKAGADTSYSAKEAAQAITELSKAGVSTKDILGGGLDGALSLAAAGSLEVADAAELAATALVQFKLSGDQIPHLADLLAAGAGKAQGSVEDLGAALNQSGLIASSTGLSIEETTGGLAAFASAGLLGSDAGTSFKTMLMALTPNSAAAANKMAELGITAYDAQGEFVGLSKFAGILQDSMKDLTQAERDAAMEVIFGSDAVRAANVLYQQGAKGIEDWTAKVNDSGYAAATAAIKQDNLAGDIEKLGGSFDSVLLKSGSGANDVLRSLTQTAESLIDAVGQIPGPILQTSLGLAATAGGAALLGGAFLTTFPRIIETKKALDELASSSPKAAAGIGKVGRAAAVAGGALVALQAAGAISKVWAGETKTVEDYAQAFLTLKSSTSDLDAVVKNTGGLGTQINGVGDALVRVNEFDWYDNLNNWAGDMLGGTSRTQQFRDSVKGLDNTLVSLVQNGGAEKAGQSFKILSDEANRSAEAQGKTGLSTEQMLKLMPQYTEELKRQGTALGLKLTTEELHDLALGKIPARMQAVQATTEGAAAAQAYQAQMTEDQAKKLEDLGITADGVIVNLSNFTTALINAGLLTLSSRDATAKFEEGLDTLDGKIKEIMATEQAHGGVLNETRTDLDLHSEAGRAANAVMQDMTTRGLQAADAMAKNGDSQVAVQGQLVKTYDAMVTTARGFGLGKDEAEALTRSILHIPPGVDVQTWMDDEAKRMAEQTTGAINGIPKDVTVTVTRKEITERHVINYERRVEEADGNEPEGGGLYGSYRDGGLVAKFNAGGEVRKFASAGYVRGPGTGTSDEIEARLSNGEYVIRASKVAQYGVKTFDAYNNGYAPLSKSVAGGYGQTHTFNGFAGTAAASAAPIQSGPLELVGTMQLNADATIATFRGVARQEAANVVSAADAQSRFMRKGG
jgi:TP901 family phage tail tape measure protein